MLRRPGSLGVYGSMGAGGVILITTKQGDASYRKPLYTPGIVTYSPQGLSEVDDFHSPDYSATDTSPETLDLRSTIYWNPTVVSDENGDATFEFYTADEPGQYRIIVEGIDVYGRMGRSETFIEVVNE